MIFGRKILHITQLILHTKLKAKFENQFLFSKGRDFRDVRADRPARQVEGSHREGQDDREDAVGRHQVRHRSRLSRESR